MPVFGDGARLASFKRSLSNARFATYLRNTANDEQRAIALYSWDVRVAGELIFALHVFEVCLRNRLSEFLGMKYGQQWPFDQVALRQLTNEDRRRLIKLVADLQTAHRGSTPSTDAVVAALSLGFWVSLLTRSYSVPFGWHGRGLRALFPHDATLTQPEVYRICNSIRILRNRVAHCEPLLHLDVASIRMDLDRVLGAMCQGSLEFVRSGCRVATTLGQRP